MTLYERLVLLRQQDIVRERIREQAKLLLIANRQKKSKQSDTDQNRPNYPKVVEGDDETSR